eukprot:EG_transcript_45272
MAVHRRAVVADDKPMDEQQQQELIDDLRLRAERQHRLCVTVLAILQLVATGVLGFLAQRAHRGMAQAAAGTALALVYTLRPHWLGGWLLAASAALGVWACWRVGAALARRVEDPRLLTPALILVGGCLLGGRWLHG